MTVFSFVKREEILAFCALNLEVLAYIELISKVILYLIYKFTFGMSSFEKMDDENFLFHSTNNCSVLPAR